MTDRMGLILGRVRRKLKTLNQNTVEDDELIDAGNEKQEEILQRADIETKFEVTLVGGQETYEIMDDNTFEIVTTILSWTPETEAFYEWVPYAEWDKYRDNDSLSYPYYFSIFGQNLHVSPKPTAAWVASDTPTIEFSGRLKKPIEPMDEDTDPELPVIFDNALVLGIVSEFMPEVKPEYYAALDLAIETYNNKKLGIVTPDCDW